MGHCDSSAHVSGYGGVCAGDGRIDEVAAAARRDGLSGTRLQGLKPQILGSFMSQLKLRPHKNPFALEIVRSAGKCLLLFVVRIYQVFLSPFFGGACKFYPSCSKYGYEAIARHGAWRG